MHDLPGTVSTTRMLTTDSARARSFIRLTICAPLTPIAGSISKRVITGPGYAASTFTATPKSASLRSITREVKSSVSALTTSSEDGASSSNASGGSGESGRALNKGFCFSLITRSDFLTSSAAGTTMTGSRSSMVSRVAPTTCSRSSNAASPMTRSRCSSRLRRAQASVFSMRPPTRSISLSQDMPVRSDQPIPNRAMSSSVAPLKPSARDSPCPIMSPKAPPGALGSKAGSR